MKVDLCIGPMYPSISLHPTLYKVDFDSDKGSSEPAYPAETLPLAIRELRLDEMRKVCENYVESAFQYEGYCIEKMPEELPVISQQIYRAVVRYFKTNPNLEPDLKALLRSALSLHHMHQFMTHTINLTVESANDALEWFTESERRAYEGELSCDTLQYQIKYPMSTLLRPTIVEIFEGLFRQFNLKVREESSCVPCFCVILLLCIYAEDIEAATDGFIIQSIIDDEGKPELRNQTILLREYVDYIMKREVIDRFKRGYSGKAVQNNSLMPTYNPVKHGFRVGKLEGVEPSALELGTEIRNLIREHRQELQELKKTCDVPTRLDDPMRDHMKFYAQNSGHLLADFLLDLNRSK